jgi:hypothetical protein
MASAFLETPRRLVEVTIDGATVRVPGGASLLEACRPRPGGRHADPLLPGEPHPGERLPGLRGRGRGVAHPGACLLAQGRGGHAGAYRLGPGPDLAQDGPGVPRLFRRPLAGLVRRATVAGRVRLRSLALRPARVRPPGRGAGRHPARRASPRGDRSGRRHHRAAVQVRQRGLRPRLRPLHPVLQVRRGLRRGRAEHLRHRRRGPRLRCARLHRIRRHPARLGLRLLRQLHRRLPHRRADAGLGVHGHLCVKGRFGFEFVQRRHRE